MNFELMDPVEVYKLVLSKKIKKFPNSYWEDDKVKKTRAKACMKYMVEEVLHYSSDDVKSKLIYKRVCDCKLDGLVTIVFDRKLNDAIRFTYPGVYMPWELSSVSFGYFHLRDNRIKAIKWLIETKCKNGDGSYKKVSRAILTKYGLWSLVKYFYGGNVFSAIDDAYPGVYKPWELTCTRHGYFDIKENRIDLISWIVKNRLNSTYDNVVINDIKDVIVEFGFTGMIKNKYPSKSIDKSIQMALNEANIN